jgi:hypothetical protein
MFLQVAFQGRLVEVAQIASSSADDHDYQMYDAAPCITRQIPTRRTGMIDRWVGVALGVCLLPMRAAANEMCWNALRNYLSGPSAQSAEVRQKALQICGEDPAHQKNALLQKMLKRCARETVGGAMKDIEECQIEAYRWNQQFEYPGPVKTNP